MPSGDAAATIPTMSNADTLLSHVLALPASERARLALCLVESLDGPPDPDAQAAWAKEIARRVGEVRDGSVTTVSAEETLKYVEARVARRRG